ncbi:MAG: glycosyltransferase family 61 protein [Oscillatoriales cyanobacterium RM1_1_9]|nr:glycosyltransferase family 61 protein [Oscillatoriales cyanobacterium RM1_1_9]
MANFRASNKISTKILDFLDLNIPRVWLDSGDQYRCQQLLFTTRLNNTLHACPWAVEASRNLLLSRYLGKAHQPPHKTIFASRKSAQKRRTNLEEKVLELFPEAEVIDFATLSIEETIQVCQSCETFVGFHGAAFANLIFCQPGTKVIEFQIENTLHNHQYYFFPSPNSLKCTHHIHISSKHIP